MRRLRSFLAEPVFVLAFVLSATLALHVVVIRMLGYLYAAIAGIDNVRIRLYGSKEP